MSEQTTTSDQATPPPPGPPPHSTYPPLHTLRRSRTDRKLLGVAGGLGRYSGIDPLIFRILFVVLAIFGGSGLLLYALGWLLVPDDGEDLSEAQRLFGGRTSGSKLGTVVAGVVVLILGLVLMGSLLDTGPGLGGLGAAVIVAVIVLLVARAGPRTDLGQAPQQPYGPVPPPEPGAYGQTPGTAYAVGPPVTTTAPLPPTYVPPPPPPYLPPPVAYVPPPPRPPKERSVLGRVTFFSALIVVGLMIAWNAASDHDIKTVAVLASALAIVGAGLVVGAFRGRARGLIVLGILLSFATSITAVADSHLVGGMGERHWTPQTVAQAEHREYRLGIGEGDLDLSQLPPGSDADIDTHVGFGHLLVTVPRDATVVVDGHVAAGVMRVVGSPDFEDDDINEVVTVEPAAGVTPSGTEITIDAEVGFGLLEVRRATS
jgi:phage shock protein PspC (stress-responsive transcriptional regulator)